MFPRIVIATLSCLTLLAVQGLAEFSDDYVPAAPDILTRIITAAERHDESLRSRGDTQSAYYLRNARYIGECRAPFGIVHVAQLAFTRSAERGSKNPARGHHFVVFLDEKLGVRAFWRSDASGVFGVNGTSVTLDGTEILDFAKLPANGTVVVDGQVQSVPTWK